MGCVKLPYNPTISFSQILSDSFVIVFPGSFNIDEVSVYSHDARTSEGNILIRLFHATTLA
jgi:hypothetical protein